MASRLHNAPHEEDSRDTLQVRCEDVRLLLYSLRVLYGAAGTRLFQLNDLHDASSANRSVLEGLDVFTCSALDTLVVLHDGSCVVLEAWTYAPPRCTACGKRKALTPDCHSKRRENVKVQASKTQTIKMQQNQSQTAVFSKTNEKMKPTAIQKLEPSQVKQAEFIHFPAHMKVMSAHVMVDANYSAIAASLRVERGRRPEHPIVRTPAEEAQVA